MAKLVSFDTNILNYSIKRESSTTDSKLIQRADLLIETLVSSKATIIIPAPSLAEFLVKVPSVDIEEYLSLLRKYYKVMPFDHSAAVIAAKIKTEKLAVIDRENETMSAEHKRNMTVDIQILAVSIACRVDVLYTQDARFYKQAKSYLKVEKLPESPRQLDIFHEEEGE